MPGTNLEFSGRAIYLNHLLPKQKSSSGRLILDTEEHDKNMRLS
jgi:hypothetical protein